MLGLQMFGVCTASQYPLPETLADIRAIGYDAIEPCLAISPVPGWEKAIWPLSEFDDIAALAQKLGLAIPSCHIFTDNLVSSVDVLLTLTERYGITRYVVKAPQDPSAETLQKTAALYAEVGRRLSAGGATLLLHNELADSRRPGNAPSVYETLLNACNGSLGAELDIGWMYAAGAYPIAFMETHADLIRIIHYKDFISQNGQPEECTIGTGDVPTDACIRYANAHHLPQLIDQDTYHRGLIPELTDVFTRFQESA